MLTQRHLGHIAEAASRCQRGWSCLSVSHTRPALVRPPHAATPCPHHLPGHRSLRVSAVEDPASAPSTSASGSTAGPDGPWTPEYIRERVRQQAAEEEAMEADALTSGFRDDPQGLYDYVDRAYEEAFLLEQLAGGGVQGYPAAAANDIIGMGTWRLKARVDPVIEFLVTRIEGCWREILDEDLSLYPTDKWKGLGWDLVDSEDPKRELEGFSYADIPDPEKGAEGYPRLQLENRVYCSRAFRKLHVEVGIRQDGLQVLHVVAYPRYSFDMPIFGMDIVLVNDRVTLAVVDCCPTRQGLKLPPAYMETMALLQRTFLEGQDPANRRIPDWGAATFSPLALCITPTSPEELAAFAKYTVALHRAYMILSLSAAPVVAVPGDKGAAARKQELLDGQKRFCDNQLSNKKTRRVLEVAFGKEWADDYMSKLMFDFDPSYEPPACDESLDLFQHLEDSFTPDDMEDYNQGLEKAAESSRVSDILEAAVDGRGVSREKVNLAMDFLFESDPTFRAAVEALAGGEGLSRELLTEEFLQYMNSPDAEVEGKKVPS